MTPLLLAVPLLLAAPVPKDFVKRSKLDGRWSVTAFAVEDRAVTTGTVLSQTWTISGENLSISRGTPAPGANAPAPTTVRLTINPRKSPMELDYVQANGNTRLGVFDLDGDTLVICLALRGVTDERPTNFDGGTGIQKYQFTRAKDK